jgi:hypothetical protein
MDRCELWKAITADLVRARATLPEGAASHQAVCLYQDFIENNELGLACDMLEQYAEECPANSDFWLALRDAAMKMQLPDRVSRYEAFAIKSNIPSS